MKLLDQLAIFLSLGSQPSVPPAGSGEVWCINSAWQQIEPDLYFLETDGSGVIEQCRAQPDKEVIFPTIHFSAQKIYLDGVLVYTQGEASSRSMSYVFPPPSLNCAQLLNRTSLIWQMWSASTFYAKFNSFPFLASANSWFGFENFL